MCIDCKSCLFNPTAFPISLHLFLASLNEALYKTLKYFELGSFSKTVKISIQSSYSQFMYSNSLCLVVGGFGDGSGFRALPAETSKKNN